MSTHNEPINDVVEHIGKAIRSRRSKMGMSMRDLAREADISLNHVCLVENGRRRISADRLYCVAVALETTVGQLFRGI
jgi:transcriptional regulator with XRE-family HTH domain